MKKIILGLLVAAIVFSNNIFGFQKLEQTKQQSVSKKFTKKDWAKVVTASIGCGYLASVAAFLSYKKFIGYKHIDPSFTFAFLAMLPLTYVEMALGYDVNSKAKGDEITQLTLVLSGALACGLGYYLYKKILKKSDSHGEIIESNLKSIMNNL